MLRYLRSYLVACVALAFGYLVVRAGEPLRLNIGDPWTDADAASSIARMFGTDSLLPVLRLLALLCSGLAAWLLFQYAHRMWNGTVAIIATALTTTSFVWMMFADSIHRPPITHAACFLALWGVVRVLETELRRHYIAALGGTFLCLLTASNQWVFLALGVLFTIYVKREDLFARESWRVIAVCAAGGLLGVLLRPMFFADPSAWQAVLDQRVATTMATLVRRYSVLLTPLLWITLGWALWRALRARSVKVAIADGTTWMLIAALVIAFLPPSRPEGAALRTQLLLPLYAIGSALLIARLFEHGPLRRAIALSWCVVAPLWGLWFMVSQPREVLDRDDLARANEYLARTDGNNFVMSNLFADGPILAAFGRRGWAALSEPDPSNALVAMLGVFEATGADYAHAIIFTTPDSRFVDRSIRQIVRHRMPSADGWPYMVPGKVHRHIKMYDERVLRSLEALGAERVLELRNFDIYRIDRSTMLETATRSLPVVRTIDFGNVEAIRHMLLGWGDAVDPTATRPTPSSIVGFAQCRNPLAPVAEPARNGCTVAETGYGLDVVDVGALSSAELVARVDRACDQQITITFAAPAHVDVAFNGALVLSCADPQWGTSSASIRVPKQHVHPGPNIIRFDDRQEEPRNLRPEVASVVIEPLCEPPR